MDKIHPVRYIAQFRPKASSRPSKVYHIAEESSSFFRTLCGKNITAVWWLCGVYAKGSADKVTCPKCRAVDRRSTVRKRK
jgi:hypothetical protein